MLYLASRCARVSSPAPATHNYNTASGPHRPAKKLKVKSEPASGRGSTQDLSGMSSQGGAAAGALSLDPESWPGMEDQDPAVRTRLTTSRALAQLCCKLQGQVREICILHAAASGCIAV